MFKHTYAAHTILSQQSSLKAPNPGEQRHLLTTVTFHSLRSPPHCHPPTISANHNCQRPLLPMHSPQFALARLQTPSCGHCGTGSRSPPVGLGLTGDSCPALLHHSLPPPLLISPTANKTCRADSDPQCYGPWLYFKEKKGIHKPFLALESNWVSPLGGTHTANVQLLPIAHPQSFSELSPNLSHVNQSEGKAGKAFQPPPTISTTVPSDSEVPLRCWSPGGSGVAPTGKWAAQATAHRHG